MLGPGDKTDPLAWEGKGKLAMIFQNVHAVTDCLDVCKFATFAESRTASRRRTMRSRAIKATQDYLFKTGERVYNLERHINNLCGFTGKDDTLPKRFLDEPSTRARLKGPGLRAG